MEETSSGSQDPTRVVAKLMMKAARLLDQALAPTAVPTE
jgi:hypothetical protein